jgi:oligoribonuclease NrnB/cAMP/cGMP phosphodiesterase (DHH superfamily)
MNPLCIYHGGCDDGFAAALVVRMALGAENVDFHPGVYQYEPPDIHGRDVILVDFSYKRLVLEGMARRANSILILDHHKTAQEDLAGMQSPLGRDWFSHFENFSQIKNEPRSNIYAEFDMERSGAAMAWDFFAKPPRPQFIEYIQDRDLWRKQLPGGDEFTIALRSYAQDFALWNELLVIGPAELIKEGRSIQRYYRLRIEELKRHSYRARLGGHECQISNAPYFAASEVAGEIAEKAEFGACYFEVAPGKFQYSLRSRGDFDVSTIAKQFGGGGHKNAAGFSTVGMAHANIA